MKLLMFNVKRFWYRTFRKTLGDAEDIDREETIVDALVVFANVEQSDEDHNSAILRKTVKLARLSRLRARVVREVDSSTTHMYNAVIV